MEYNDQAEINTGAQTAVETESRKRDGVVLVAALGDPVSIDLVSYLSRRVHGEVVLIADESIGPLPEESLRLRHVALDEFLRGRTAWNDASEGPTSLFLFVDPSAGAVERRKLSELLHVSGQQPVAFVGIVSSFRIHLDDAAEKAECEVLDLIEASGVKARVMVFRPGRLLGARSRATHWLKRLAPFYPLASRRLRSCFIEEEAFFAAIEAERTRGLWAEGEATSSVGRKVGGRPRAYTLLGTNRAWRDVLFEHRTKSAGQAIATATATVLSWFMVGQLVALMVAILAKANPRAAAWSVHTLKPRSMRELISLCHVGNIKNVRVVGYNNGVNHFGQRCPGRTIVSTVRCNRITHTAPLTLKVDCGATIRGVRDYLDVRGEELYVVPNYSYVCLGTAFFVPIHGSAVDYSTVADTVTRVVFYDPDQARIVSATRDEAGFQETLYNLRSRVVVLRLYLKARLRSSYFVRRETWINAAASRILEALRDHDAANVEIRQGHARSPRVTVNRYYTTPSGPAGPALDCPRDALGRLWDRLEENPVTSFLMHALSRHVAWHTELFFSPKDFDVFWSTHGQVPLRKIQLRYIRRDGMPHSPFRDEDCVSADLFLFRFDKPAFDAYLARTFSSVRCNPGKHSH